MPKPKSLLIILPIAPGGSCNPALEDWRCAVEVQAYCRLALRSMAGEMNDLGSRLKLNEAALSAGTDWALSHFHLLGVPPDAIEGDSKPMFPEHWHVVTIKLAGRPIPANRNDAVRKFLKSRNYQTGEYGDNKFDALLMIDSDLVPGPDDLMRTCEALDREEIDIFSGIYCMDGPLGPAPIIHRIIDHNRMDFATDLLTGSEELIETANAAVPGGWLAAKRYVYQDLIDHDVVPFKDRFNDGSLEAYEISTLRERHQGDDAAFAKAIRTLHDQRMGEDWGTWDDWGDWKCGEDIWFCRRAQELGHKLWVDKKIHLPHMKKTDLKKVFINREAGVRKGFMLGHEASENGFSGDKDGWEAFMADRANKVAARTEEKYAGVRAAAAEQEIHP